MSTEKIESTPISINGVIVDKNTIAATLPTQLRFRTARTTRRLPPQNRRPTAKIETVPEPTVINKNIVPEHLIERNPEPQSPQPEPEPAAEKVEVREKIVLKAPGSKTVTIESSAIGKEPVTIDLSDIDIPDFDKMSYSEHMKRRGDLIVKINTIASTCKDYRLPSPGEIENMSTGEIYRYIYGYTNFIAVKNVMTSYRAGWTFFCLIVEAIGLSLGLQSVRGYTKMQLKKYIDIESSFIQLGCESVENGGIGFEKWPPLFKILFLSFCNLVVLIALRFLCKKLSLSPESADGLADLVMEFISGKREIPEELINGAARSMAESPGDPIQGLLGGLSSIDWSSGLGLLKNMMSGGNKSGPKSNDQIFDS